MGIWKGCSYARRRHRFLFMGERRSLLIYRRAIALQNFDEIVDEWQTFRNQQNG
ncbi:MAG: hypothetical protein ACSI46_27710 [Gloeotrichia echinulata DVL01]|nr:hypothetical protein [Gloeotrichia echinulata DEX184]